MAAKSPQPQGSEECVSDEFLAPMCQTHTMPIQFCCQNHNTPVCSTCKLMNHKKCQLQDLEQAATGTAVRSLHALHQLRETEANMKKIGDVMENEIESLEAQKDLTIEQIKRKMEELEALGAKKIAEVEEKFSEEWDSLDREAQDIKKSTMLVEKSIKKMESATNIDSKEEIGLARTQAENDASKYQDIVRESSQVSHTEINFEVDNRLTDVASIGDVQVEKSNVSVDLTPELTEVLIYTQQSERQVQVKWFEVLPNDQMIVLGYDTSLISQVRLYSSTKEFLSQLDLPTAVSAASLDDNQIIVPLYDTQKLQIVNLDNNNLTKGDSVKTDAQPWLILKYSDTSVLVLAQLSDDTCSWCFQILDLTGKVVKHITLSTDLYNPTFMRMSRERSAVYIIDSDIQGCLGFNLQGDMTFHYRGTDYEDDAGLAVDLHGAIYFSAKNRDQGNKCMIKLSPAGQLLREIDITGIRPLQCIGNKVYVGKCNDQGDEIIGYFFV